MPLSAITRSVARVNFTRFDRSAWKQLPRRSENGVGSQSEVFSPGASEILILHYRGVTPAPPQPLKT